MYSFNKNYAVHDMAGKKMSEVKKQSLEKHSDDTHVATTRGQISLFICLHL